MASLPVALILFCVSAPARAAFAPIFPAAPNPEAVAPPPPPAPVASPETQHEALLDMAFQALYQGNLTLSEQAFRQAAGLPGDPARSAVAASFAERVRRLRATSRTLPRLSPPSAGTAVAGQPGAAAAAPSSNEAARTVLNMTTSMLGLGLYGWTLPAALGLGASSDNGFVGVYLLTAGTSVIAPYLMTRASPITPGQANLAYYGATRGAWHGVLLSAALFGNVGPDRRFRLWAGSLLTGSVAELTAGYFFARSDELTAGEARTIAIGGDFGLGWGMATGAILGLHHDNHSEDAQARGIAIAGLLGATAGLGGGYLLAQRRDNSWGDGEVMRAAGLFGTWAGLTVDALFGWEPSQSDQKKFYSALILGGAAGLWGGDRLVRNTDFTVGEGVLVDLSTLAGGLGAAGLTYVLKSNDGSGLSAKTWLGATSLGGALGFCLAYVGLRQGALHRANLQEAVASRASNIAVLPLIGKKGEQGLSLAGTF